MTDPKPHSLREFLVSLPLFADLDGRSLDSVVSVLREQTFEPGTVICTEGEPGHTMYVVVSGEVDVLRNNRADVPVPIARLSRGECFGEMALVEQQPRAASVAALRRTTVLSLRDADLFKLFTRDNYAFVILLQNLCRLLSHRLREADGRIAEFLSKDHERRSVAARHGAEHRPTPGRKAEGRRPRR